MQYNFMIVLKKKDLKNDKILIFLSYIYLVVFDDKYNKLRYLINYYWTVNSVQNKLCYY